MKRVVFSVILLFAVLIALLFLFSENIGVFTANILYNDDKSEFVTDDTNTKAELKTNDYLFLGKYNGEPILWKVITVNENKVPLLLSEKILCFLPFNSGEQLTADSSNWDKSDIRIWLNSSEDKSFDFYCTPENKIKNNRITVSGGFLCRNNFTAEEISAIRSNPDTVFLPSKDDLNKLSTKERIKSPTASAVINDGTYFVQLRKGCWYWTRSPISTNTSSVTTVTSSGSFYKSISNDGLTGVCPSIELKSNSVTVCGGNGTVETPYVFGSEVLK